MINFSKNRAALQAEFDAYYGGCPYDCSAEQAQLDRWYDAAANKTVYERKALVYRGAAELCPVQIFDHSPFYYEIRSGRERNTSQNGFPPGPGLEGWYMRKHLVLNEPFVDYIKTYEKQDLVWGGVFSDHAHHTVGYDTLLRIGYSGIEQDAQKYLEKETDPEKQGFYRSVITACEAMRQIGLHYAQAAAARLEQPVSPEAAESLRMIRDTAGRVPYMPPKTFYEALAAILFAKELAIDLEGVAVAVLGHLDRLLQPFYAHDIETGALTYEEAKNLMAFFLYHTDGRWELTEHTFASTNCSLVIGGCDGNGKPIYNDVTRMILECYEDYGFVNPKIQVRIGSGYPQELQQICARMIAKGCNVFSFLNDDVQIEAAVRMGKTREDARLYSAGGCQEPILDNCEFNSRAFVYISLPQLLNAMLDPALCSLLPGRQSLPENGQYPDFESLYQAYMQQLSELYADLVQHLNERESHLPEFCCLPLLSCTMTGCLESGRDMTAGGAKYNAISLPLVGIGTAIDSLLAIRQVVYEEKRMTLAELANLLQKNYAAQPRMRDYLQNRCAKYGDDSDAVNAFSARFFHDAAEKTSGYRSARGAIYEASLFVFYLFDWMKEHVGATADGRERGHVLSRGMNPPDTSAHNNIPELLHTVSSLDLADWPGAAVLYLEMPVEAGSSAHTAAHLQWVINGFQQASGSALDLQMLDPQQLVEARRDPASHSNIIVRVCGFSAYFTSLDPKIQDEIIERSFANG